MKRSWPAMIVAFVLALIGVVLTIGGGWLVALGGSIYYFIAGIALLASAWFLFKGRMLGGWIYVGLFILSAIWGFAELRGNAWAMVPWLVAPLVLLIVVLLVMPTLTPDRNRWKLAGGGIALGLVFVVVSFALLGMTGGSAVAALPAQSSPGMTDPSLQTTGADWPDYGGTNAAWRYSPLTQINASNVGKLEKVWEVHTGGTPTDPNYTKLYGTENTPLKVGNLLYTCTAKNVIVALDAATGKPVWRVDPKVPDKWIPYTTACRGVAYYKVPGAAADSAVREPDHRRDARFPPDRGRRADRQGMHGLQRHRPAGHQDRHGPGLSGLATINSAPTIVRGIVVVPHQILDGQCRCSPSGVIQGFDAVTGKLAWAWDVEHPEWNGYPPPGQTWTKATPNSWMSSFGRREARPRLSADGQFRRRLYLDRPAAALQSGIELDRRDRRHQRQAEMGVPDRRQGRLGL